MAYSRKKKNDKRAQSLEKPISQIIKRALSSCGKPTYYLIVIVLIGSIIGSGYLISLLGYIARLLATRLLSFPKRLPKFTKVVIGRRVKNLQAVNISWPRLNVARPRMSYKVLVITFLLFATPVFGFWFFILKDLPSPKELIIRDIDVSTKILDRNGILLYKIYKAENRTIIALSDIPQHVRLAALAAEDAEFYEHPGFSIRGISRAIVKNLEKGELTGGSTITQQLVKNRLLTDEKTIQRKLKEIVLAIRVELTFTKDEILEMYLNEVSYGGTAYGIQEASEAYFAKNAKDLNISESAFLAGLPKSPSRYSPFSGSFEAGQARQKDVINLMHINKFISQQEKDNALNQKLTFSPNKIDIKAPHFVMYVRSLLAEKYGEEMVETGGLEVVTTLDYEIQKLAEEVVKQETEKLKNMRVGNGAVVVTDPKTGEILAMVGSKDYFDVENDGNVNVALRPRQPGSSIKIVNYAYALSHNYTPATMIDDSPITYKVAGQPPYTPQNYDGNYRGKISLRSALAESRNIPAVRTLKSYGVENMIELGEKMGITTWGDKSRFGLSLTLGGGETKLLDLAQVYSTVANYGEKKEKWTIRKVVNYKGKVFEENTCTANLKNFSESLVKIPTADAAEASISTCKGEQILDERVAYLLTDILKDNNARAPAFGRNSQLVIPGHTEVAVKTGTSNDLRDNLTVGFMKDYVVAVWVGNNDNSPMSRIASGLTGASTIFNKIMRALLSEKESFAWEAPPGLVKMPVCTITGTLPCEGCPTRMEWFLQEKKPLLACRPEQVIAYKQEKERKEGLQTGQILEPAASTETLR